MKKSWQTKPLLKVCQIKPPKSEARDRLAANELVTFLPMEDMGINEMFVRATQERQLSAVQGSYTYFADGDVLLAKITPCFENGKLGIAEGLTNGIGFGSSEYIVFRPDKTISKEWLYYYLSRETFRAEGAAHMSGAVGHKRVSKDFIESYPIPVPTLPEQLRIVGILDEAVESIAIAKANTEKNLQNARALFEGHLQSVFSSRGKGWVDTVLEDVCGFQNGFAFKSSSFKPSGCPILRISNIQGGRVDTYGLVFFDPRDYRENLDRYRIVGGDLLIAMSGATTGKIGFNTTSDTFYLNQRVGKFEPGKKLNKRFLYYFLSTKVEENLSISAGSAQPNLSTEQIKNFTLPLPSLAEQTQIVASLDILREEMQHLAMIYEQKVGTFEELKKTLLHQAFNGQL
jgi:type I restriction enzyme S subunit